MLREEIKDLTLRLDEVESKYDEMDMDDIGSEEYENLESKVYEIEREISEHSHIAQGIQYTQLQKLMKRITQIKRDNDYYDEDAELDMMFPNRHDDDFDEDSMSYDSVFGGD